MVTASHNPPSDNAVKAYWSTGGQILPPHDKGVIERVMNVRRHPADPVRRRRWPPGRIVYCQEEVDRAFIGGRRGPEPPRAAGSEDHLFAAARRGRVGRAAGAGRGRVSRRRTLRAARRARAAIFPTCRATSRIRRTRGCSTRSSSGPSRRGAELILATDPDCDRVGCAAPQTLAARRGVGHAHRQPDRRAAGRLSAGRPARGGHAHAGALRGQDAGHHRADPPHRRRLRRANGRRSAGRLQVDRRRDGRARTRRSSCSGPRNRTASWSASTRATRMRRVASMLLAELAARAKADGLTLHEKLDELFRRYGCHAERTISVTMPGAEGMDRMKAADGASSAPSRRRRSGGLTVARMRDYQARHDHARSAARSRPLAGPDRRPGDARPGRRGQLRRGPPLGHRAEGEVLHVRLRPARHEARISPPSSRRRSNACRRSRTISASSPACPRGRKSLQVALEEYGARRSARRMHRRTLYYTVVPCPRWPCPRTIVPEPIITVSGLRGIIGETLTPPVAIRYVAALAASLPPGPLVVGRDGRPSGRMLAEAIHAGLAAVGRDTIDAGVAATPTVGVFVRHLGAAGGVQITASHNPPPYNGLKLFSGEGRVFPDAAGAQGAREVPRRRLRNGPVSSTSAAGALATIPTRRTWPPCWRRSTSSGFAPRSTRSSWTAIAAPAACWAAACSKRSAARPRCSAASRTGSSNIRPNRRPRTSPACWRKSSRSALISVFARTPMPIAWRWSIATDTTSARSTPWRCASITYSPAAWVRWWPTAPLAA